MIYKESQHFLNLYDKLTSFLYQYKLGWVVQEVEKTIAEDKLNIEQRYIEEDYSTVVTVPYTPEEIFLLLIDAIKRSTVDIQYIKEEVLEMLASEVQAEALQELAINFDSQRRNDNYLEIKSSQVLEQQNLIKEWELVTQLEEIRKTTLRLIDSSLYNTYRYYNYDLDKKVEDLTKIERLWYHLEINYDYNYLCYVADIFLLIIKAARAEGAEVEYITGNGEQAKVLRFRKTPGQIYTDNGHFTHAILEFDSSLLLEVHAGIRSKGKSGVLHECDLCVLPHKKAEFCRDYKCSPESSDIAIACECKYYSSNLNLDLARSFIGLTSDLNVEGNYYFISNSESKSVAKLLTKYKKKWTHNVFPKSPNDVNKLLYSFQRDFQEIKARFS